MNAAALKFDSEAADGHCPPTVTSEWEMVGQFPTVEAAKKTIERLAARGVEARSVLIDGVTVLARLASPATH